MIIIDVLLLLPLVAIPISGFTIKLDGLDTFRDLDLITHATTRNIDAYDKIEEANEKRLTEKEERLVGDSHPSTPSTSSSNRLRHERSPKFKEEDACGLHPLSDHCNDLISSRVSSSVSSSVSSVVSSSVSNNDASILTSSLSAARDEGFRDGQSRVSESAQSAIDSAKASASSMVESVLSVVRSTPSAGETVPSVADGLNRTSHGLSINARQLAGIVVGVFFVSSILSVLTTLLFLWYRRRRTAIAQNRRRFPAEEKKKMLWPTLGKLRGNLFYPSSPASGTAGRRGLSKILTPRLKRGRRSQSQHIMPFANPIPFTSPLSPGLNSDQMFPVSPMSDQPPGSSGRDSSPSLGIGLYGNRTQTSSKSETSDVPPIGFLAIRNLTQPKTPNIRIGGQETDPRLLSNVQASHVFPLNERSAVFTDYREGPDMRDATNRMERGMVTLTPIVRRSALSPPIIPLRFSSLNAQRGPPPMQSSAGLHDNDGTFLLSTDEESGDRDPEFSQNQSGLQSPSPSHSSIISQDLTQFDPGGPGPQPISRFSVSSAPLSLGYSASSSSPTPQDHQQHERSVISPLRPAPPSPSQLHSPVPRRLNAAVSLASLEPAINRNSQGEANRHTSSEGEEAGTSGG
ncbi:hypothetical protein EV127DRAFT_200561 [Xylaria flabelliformis]|nr:hypothetical protein EV127DRAFT_200561 [Xylaria flabelliformis]